MSLNPYDDENTRHNSIRSSDSHCAWFAQRSRTRRRGKLDNLASPENALAREAERVNLNLEAAQGEHQARRRLSDSSDGPAA